MYAMGDKYMAVIDKMTEDIRATFDQLPDDCQLQYITMWLSRSDLHGAHRDILPAFLAGWDAGQNDMLRRYNLRVHEIATDFFASLFPEQRTRRRRKSAS